MPGPRTEYRRALRHFNAALKKGEEVYKAILGDAESKLEEARNAHGWAAIHAAKANEIDPAVRAAYSRAHDELMDVLCERLRKGESLVCQFMAQMDAYSSYVKKHGFPEEVEGDDPYRERVVRACRVYYEADRDYSKAKDEAYANREAAKKEADEALARAESAYRAKYIEARDAQMAATEGAREAYYEAKDAYDEARRRAEAAAKEAYKKVMRGE